MVYSWQTTQDEPNTKSDTMKALVLVVLCMFPVVAFAAASRFTNLTDHSGRLCIAAVADQQAYGTNDRPIITVTFSNASASAVALVNHFAYTAIGPLFQPLLRNPQNTNQYRDALFEKQLSICDAQPLWIILQPSEVHRFTSALYDRLPVGHHFLQVVYAVSGPAECVIADCRKEPGCPKEFWHGALMSNVVKIDVNTASPNDCKKATD